MHQGFAGALFVDGGQVIGIVAKVLRQFGHREIFIIVEANILLQFHQIAKRTREGGLPMPLGIFMGEFDAQDARRIICRSAKLTFLE